jgi:hypothetical protein
MYLIIRASLVLLLRKLFLFTVAINVLFVFTSCAAYTIRSTKYHTMFVFAVTYRVRLKYYQAFFFTLIKH